MKKNKTSDAAETCYRCEWHERMMKGSHGEVVRTAYGDFDMTEARRIVRGRKTVMISARALAFYNARDGFSTNIHEPHLAHVNKRVPVIFGTLRNVPFIRHYIMDGMHRATIQLRAGRGVRVVILTAAETESCRMKPERRKRKKETDERK